MSDTQPQFDSQPGPSLSPEERERQAWAPLVLSLDGGGVRGLSSLYILRAVMQKVRDIDDTKPEDRKLEVTQGLPLPCNYFDFIIGTSTGGLIAVMLGRLRMDIEDCIQQYWIMTVKIFRPYHVRVIRMYSRRVLQESVKEVVKAFCDCHGEHQTPCDGIEDLRQYDYEEGFEQRGPDYCNKTCKVAVLTIRKLEITGSQKSTDINVLFRSYNHLLRPGRDTASGEYNPKTLGSSKLKIHEACAATSAAPTYFHRTRLRGREHIDGGLWANNPAAVAWNEAVCMGEPPNGIAPYGNNEVSPSVMPRMLLSIGTGARSVPSRFGIISILKYSILSISSTKREEENAKETVRATQGSDYFRLDVPETLGPGYNGLSKIGLAECKKKRIRRRSRNNHVETTTQNGNPQSSSSDETQSNITIDAAITVALNRDRDLREQAATRNTDFDPQNFRYTTFDKIRDRTIRYIHYLDRDTKLGQTSIDKCAHLLWEASRTRKDLTERRWLEFREHPNPRFQNTARNRA